MRKINDSRAAVHHVNINILPCHINILLFTIYPLRFLIGNFIKRNSAAGMQIFDKLYLNYVHKTTASSDETLLRLFIIDNNNRSYSYFSIN